MSGTLLTPFLPGQCADGEQESGLAVQEPIRGWIEDSVSFIPNFVSANGSEVQ